MGPSKRSTSSSAGRTGEVLFDSLRDRGRSVSAKKFPSAAENLAVSPHNHNNEPAVLFPSDAAINTKEH